MKKFLLPLTIALVIVERGPSMILGMPAHATTNTAQEARAIQSCIVAGESPAACGETAPMDDL